MILRPTHLQTDSLKGLLRLQSFAVALLEQLCKYSRYPTYDSHLSESQKFPGIITHCKLPGPSWLSTTDVCGAGNHLDSGIAKEMAALDVLQRLEAKILQSHLDVVETHAPNLTRKQKAKLISCVYSRIPGSIVTYQLQYIQQRRQAAEIARQSAPVDIQHPDASWDHLPLDASLTHPNSRKERIEFTPDLMENSYSFQTARSLTITSQKTLPCIVQNSEQNEIVINHIPIRVPEESNALSFGLCQLHSRYSNDSLFEDRPPSFGMAKLFVELPRHHVPSIQRLLQSIEDNPLEYRRTQNDKRKNGRRRHSNKTAGASALQKRRDIFREFQRKLPLSVDRAPISEAPVVLVHGDTGTGKTTRYPLMLSLNHEHSKVVVAQPRRLACQAAAERVAFEQDTVLGKGPIGYAIRFDNKTGVGSNTVDFCTPGILLRRAMEDPMMSDVTHLCIDEVHERNADIDLLLALARSSVKLRQNTDNPLQLVLMSATVEADTWSQFFAADELELEIIDVPEERRFPIDIVHLDSPDLPMSPDLRALKALQTSRFTNTLDEQLCRATAELALHLFATDDDLDGSVLCFLPGMEEIRQTDEFIRQFNKRQSAFSVLYLHSSISSQEQRRVFDEGPKIILSTNIAETSLTIPDVKYVIDSGRERQHSLIDHASTATTVVGSELATVDVSKAAAKQRAGRAGRVAAGTCYRLYDKSDFDTNFESHTVPEMLRMDLSQLALHALSFNSEGEASDPLHLLLNSPDPPDSLRLEQTLRSLSHQGLIEIDLSDRDSVVLTPLGRAVSAIPVPPIIGRMLFVGLVLRAIRPALQIAAVLSVPKLSSVESIEQTKHCSDIVRMVQAYEDYLNLDENERENHPEAKLFDQVNLIEWQLEKHMMQVIRRLSRLSPGYNVDFSRWNDNGDRIASVVALICSATPHIAHYVGGDANFSTRDFAGEARLHPSSANFSSDPHPWYVYNELRVTKRPYFHLTTAVSPLDMALFAEASDFQPQASDQDDSKDDRKNWIFIVDQWIPVDVSDPNQRETILKLRRLLDEMLQQVAQDPGTVQSSLECQQIIHYVLSSLDQQRMPSIESSIDISQEKLEQYTMQKIKTEVMDVYTAAVAAAQPEQPEPEIGKEKSKSKDTPLRNTDVNRLADNLKSLANKDADRSRPAKRKASGSNYKDERLKLERDSEVDPAVEEYYSTYAK